MANENIEAAWNEMKAALAQAAIPADVLELIKAAFYTGSWTATGRIMKAAEQGVQEFTETINDIQAEYAEHQQQMRQKLR